MQVARQSFTRETPDFRRQSLIEATARCLAKHGAQGISVRAICAEAGVSPGLLRHYFTGINDAIAEAYHWTGSRVETALAHAVANPPFILVLPADFLSSNAVALTLKMTPSENEVKRMDVPPMLSMGKGCPVTGMTPTATAMFAMA